jgi:hypothetical protein
MIIARMREYGAAHTVMPVIASQFGHLSLARYGQFQARMEQLGFRFLTDVEIPEVSNLTCSVMAPTMLRTMTSGVVVATYYQVRPRVGRRLLLLGLGLLNLRLIAAPRDFIAGMRTRHCVQLHSEFDDGRSLTTGNGQAAASITPPPSVERHLFPWGTPLATLLATHRQRFDEIAGERADARPVVVSTLQDLLDMHRRQNARKLAHRTAVGVVTRDEIRRMCARNPALADAVCAEVEKLLAHESSSSRPSPPAEDPA